MKIVIGFISFLVILFFGIAVANYVADTLNGEDLREREFNANVNDNVLINNGSTDTLTYPPTEVYSVNTTNQTWTQYDGTGDYIDITNPTTFNANKNWTVSLWQFITPLQTTGFRVAFGLKNASNAGFLMIKPNNGDIGIKVDTNTTNQVSYLATNQSGSWHNWLFVHNVHTKTIQMWDNSTNRFNRTYVGELPNSASVVGVGQAMLDGADWLGSIDEVRFYNKTLTPPEIITIYQSGRYHNNSLFAQSGTNLQLYLSMNEDTGTIAYDTSGNSNNGNLIGGVSYRNDGVNVSLVEDTDYTLSGDQFTLINDRWSFSKISLFYDSEEFNEWGFHVMIIKLLVGFIALAILCYIAVEVITQYRELEENR